MRRELLERLQNNFMGLDRLDPVVEGPPRRRVYLDSGASTLMPRAVYDALGNYYDAATANSHTEAHRAGRDTTLAIEDSRDSIGRLVGYNPDTDVVLFTANGATGAINFLARALFPPELRPIIKRFKEGPSAAFIEEFKGALGEHGSEAVDAILERPLVLVSAMEHHSNLLPWMEAVGHHNVRAFEVNPKTGALDMDSFKRKLEEDGDRIRLVAVTGFSNVTGIVTPVHEMAELAHQYGAEILVDGAQWVPHAPVSMHSGQSGQHIDYLAISGHKLYAPGSRGALIGRLQTLAGSRCVTDVGGGMVEYVSIDDYHLKEEVTAREEAGTPNIPGSISMGLVAELLLHIGMDVVAEEEERLTDILLESMAVLDGITVYGSTDPNEVERGGVVSFNVDGIDHGLVAAYLNDFHNIAVRDGCFCAHPYIKRLLIRDPLLTDAVQWMIDHPERYDLPRPGMVRASLGIYSTEEDIDALVVALSTLVVDKEKIVARYTRGSDGHFVLNDGTELPQTFGVATEINDWVASQ